MPAPLVLIHGFTDSTRTWDLVLPRLQAERDVLVPALPGHFGGPPLPERITPDTLADAVERALDDAGVETADVAGNSLGGYVALQLAERGRARSVVALAPGGGWTTAGERDEVLDFFVEMRGPVVHAAPHADRIAANPKSRARSLQFVVADPSRVPADLVAHQIRAAAACDALPMIDVARDGYPLDAELVTCPLRFVWGGADAILRWPSAADRYRRLFPHADWVVLDDVGHCPQLERPLETAELILGFSG